NRSSGYCAISRHWPASVAREPTTTPPQRTSAPSQFAFAACHASTSTKSPCSFAGVLAQPATSTGTRIDAILARCMKPLLPKAGATNMIVSVMMMRGHDDDRWRTPPAAPAAIVRAPARTPERVVPAAIAAVVASVVGALRPQVDLVGGYLWKGIIEFADLVLLGAVEAAGDGEVAPLGEYFRIVEALAAGDEAAVAAIVVIARARIGIQFARQDLEA